MDRERRRRPSHKLIVPKTVGVYGLRETIQAMEARGTAAKDLSLLMERVGRIVATGAKGLARRNSGTMANNIRPSRTKTKAVVRAGSARVPYAGVQHFGWAARNITPNPYLYEALDDRRTAVLDAFNREVAQITKGTKK